MTADAGGTNTHALAGVRVLDFSHQVAGPSATMMLALMGADVVKVIAPGARDSYEHVPFYLNNISKRSIELDLKSPEGHATALRLAERADVAVENFSPGVVERLNLGYDTLRAVNPRLIYARIKGFARDSPYANYPCWDPIAQAMSGSTSITGPSDGPPMRPGPDIADSGSGMVMLAAIVAALYQREHDGQGQHLELAMADHVATFMRVHYAWPIERGVATPRTGNDAPFTEPVAPSGIYPCKPFGTNDYIHIHAGNNRQWQSFLTAIGRQDLSDEPRFATMRNRGQQKPEIDTITREWAGGRDKMQAMRQLGEAGVPAAAVRSTAEVLADDDLHRRGIFVPLTHPAHGDIVAPGWPVEMSRSPMKVVPPPEPGAHTDQVLAEWLGDDPRS